MSKSSIKLDGVDLHEWSRAWAAGLTSEGSGPEVDIDDLKDKETEEDVWFKLIHKRLSDDLSRQIEVETGVRKVCADYDMTAPPFFGFHLSGHSQCSSRLTSLLATTGSLEVTQAVKFLMPSTTDFGRSRIGPLVARWVQSSDPRIVSLGCSTGVEVYWIVHYLKNAGLLYNQTKVRGIDINESALEIARGGSYPDSGVNEDFVDAFAAPNAREALVFDEPPGTVRFRDELRQHVDFTQANLLNLESLRVLGLRDMHVVVLMHTLKHMNPGAVQVVLSNAAAILSEGGCLLTDVANSNFALVREHPLFEFVEQDTGNACLRKVGSKA
jgi:chemotaxis methyl-accepting protein methylase